MHVQNLKAKAFITHQMLGKVILRTKTKDLYMVDGYDVTEMFIRYSIRC